MYYPFRQWFLSRLMNFEFPIWNPYWGAGHEAVIWATVPIDPYTLLEWVIGPRYSVFHLIQCSAIILGAYVVFRKFDFDTWVSAMGSLLFFMSPLVTFWFFEFINTNTFIAHMFTFLFMMKWFECGRCRYFFLMGWAFFLGMFGTKLEFWFFEAVFFGTLPVFCFFIFKPSKPSILLMTWGAIFIAILAQSWQINLLLNALIHSGRPAIPHGLHHLFSLEMYKNLFLSMGDSDLIPTMGIGTSFFIALNTRSFHYRRFFFATGIILSLLCKPWNFPFIRTFIQSPILWGALLATAVSIQVASKRNLLSAWILFLLPAYYWCKPIIDFDELYLIRIAPVFFKVVWSFLVWLGCSQLHRFKVAQVAYLSILMVFFLEGQGQILLSYLFGFLWMPARDNYLIDFSFVVISVFGTRASFSLKPILLKGAVVIIALSSYPNLYYTAAPEPVPGSANQLISHPPSYDPFVGVPELKKIFKSWDYLPFRRSLDPDMENGLPQYLGTFEPAGKMDRSGERGFEKGFPQNQGTFLLEKTGNASFYGSMAPVRYRELIQFYGYNISPRDNVFGYPSVYSEKRISRLPKVQTKGFSNALIYYFTVWAIPPLKQQVLNLLGVNYVISRDEKWLSAVKDRLKFDEVVRSDSFTVARLSGTLPRSFLVLNVHEGNLSDFQQNMNSRIILETKNIDSDLSVYRAKAVEFLKYEPEYVAIQVQSSSGGYLVLTDVFHPYWSAAVDEKAAEIIPAFHAFRAVKVPAGSHRVEFFCKIPHFKTTLFITLVVIFVSVVFTVCFWNKRINHRGKEKGA